MNNFSGKIRTVNKISINEQMTHLMAMKYPTFELKQMLFLFAEFFSLQK